MTDGLAQQACMLYTESMTRNQRIMSISLLIASLVVLVFAVIHSVWLTVLAMTLLALSQAILLYTDRRS